MDTLLQDLRYALRRLGRSRGFTVAAVLTLALGIGSTSAIFSVVSGILLRPLPYPESERIDRVFTTHPDHGTVPTSAPDFLELQAESRTYEALAAYSESTPNLTGAGDPTRLTGLAVSASFFRVLGVHPQLGRGFAAEENEPGNHRVVILSDALWRQRFGGEAGVLGRTLQLNGEPFQVVGVMPPGFNFPDHREIWFPLEYSETFTSEQNRMNHFLTVIGRRAEGVDVTESAVDVRNVAAGIAERHPQKAEFRATARPLHEQTVEVIRTPLLVLFGAVGLLLLIACVNVANLLLARAAAREGEFAVRTALGAERIRLIRQLVTESLILSVLGGALGLLLSVWGTGWLAGLQSQGIPRLEEVRIDWYVVAFTTGVSLLTGLLFGLVPAVQTTRGDLAGAIRAGGRGTSSTRREARTRSALVTLQMALAVMLLSGAGLLMRSFVEMRAIDPGFSAEGALAFDISLPSVSYPEPERLDAFFGGLLERVGSIPGVEAVGATTALPMSGGFQRSPVIVEGEERPRDGEEGIVQVRRVTPGYFGAMGVPLVRGRPLQGTDGEGAPRIVLISRAAAERYFPQQDPIGMRLALAGSDGPDWAEVIGVVGDTRDSDLTLESEPTIYFSNAQIPARQLTLVVRSGSDPMRLVPAIRGELRSMDSNLPVFNVRTLEQVIGASLADDRFYLLLLSIFAGCALLLASIGIFGVISNLVVQRTSEIGIRIALGAAPDRILGLVVQRTLLLVGAGALIGLAGAATGSKLLDGLLYQVSPTDPMTLVAVVGVLIAASATASYIPARRAVRISPLLAMRRE